MADERWVTFDVYGTMIDWMGGIRGELARLWPDEDADRLLDRYHELEPGVEEGRAIPYREVLAETLARLASDEGLSVPAGEEGALGDSLPSWKPFPEVPGALAELRGQGFKLVPLSNTDPEFLAASEKMQMPPAYQDADEFKAWWDKDTEMLAAAIRRMPKPDAKK